MPVAAYIDASINKPRNHTHEYNGKCALTLNVDKQIAPSKSNPNRLGGKLYLLPLVNSQNQLSSRFADYNLVLAYMISPPFVSQYRVRHLRQANLSQLVRVRCKTGFIKYKYNLPTVWHA